MSKYKAENNKKLSIKTEGIIKNFPQIAREFFRGIDGLADNTKLSYAVQLNIFFSYIVEKGYVAAETMQGITVEDLAGLEPGKIEDFIVYIQKYSNDKKNLSNITINHYIAALNSLYKYICSHKKIDYNPMSVVSTRKKTDKGVTYLTDRERVRFIETAETVKPMKSGKLSDKKIRDSIRNTAIIKLFLSTGIRVSELVGLDVRDINFEEHCITVDRKGGDVDHSVFFSDDAENAVKEYLAIRDEYIPKKKVSSVEEEIQNKATEKPETALFLSGRGGKRITVRGVEAMIEKCTKNSDVGGKRITPHKLRSSFAVHRLENNGYDIKDVQDCLHHKNIATTLVYLDETSKSRKQRNRNL